MYKVVVHLLIKESNVLLSIKLLLLKIETVKFAIQIGELRWFRLPLGRGSFQCTLSWVLPGVIHAHQRLDSRLLVGLGFVLKRRRESGEHEFDVGFS